MATISLAQSGATHSNRMLSKVPYMVERTIDLADAATEKGSALAQGDVIEAVAIPAGSFVLVGGFQVVDEMTGTSADATVDMGITGGDVDAYVDGFDLDGAAAGAYATKASTATDGTYFATADTIDLLIATQTGTITGGSVRVWAVVLDVTEISSPGIAQLGS